MATTNAPQKREFRSILRDARNTREMSELESFLNSGDFIIKREAARNEILPREWQIRLANDPSIEVVLSLLCRFQRQEIASEAVNDAKRRIKEEINNHTSNEMKDALKEVLAKLENGERLGFEENIKPFELLQCYQMSL